VSNNIAEGFHRGSVKDFIRFLNISRASVNEVRSMIELGKRIGHLNEINAVELEERSIKLSIQILRLIRSQKRHLGDSV